MGKPEKALREPALLGVMYNSIQVEERKMDQSDRACVSPVKT
jgi:hypothetical protein